MQGDLIWSADLGDMRTRLGWGEAVTPALSRDALIVNWDQEEDSFITALDKKTGQPIWKTARAGEPTTWNTPLVTEVDGKTLIVVNGPERVRAYDASSGKEVWQCGGQTVNPIPSPVRFEDTVICISGYRGAAGMAIPLSSQGDVTDSPKIRWKISEGTPYVPSPALSSGRLIFTGGNNGLLTCVDAKTGKVLISKRRLSGIANIYASPTVANGHVYLASREGTTIVLKDNENLDLVAVNQLEGSLDASPVAVGNQLLLRSWDTVYCLADPAS
jgi:outer membrane protein assembly factor BamB